MDELEKILVSRTVAVPADTNPWGDIFGGWIVSLMDIAAGTIASRLAKGSVATKVITDIMFHMPIFVGDEVSVYSTLQKIGNTSLTLMITVNVRRHHVDEEVEAVKGTFVMVALDEDRRPRPVKEKWKIAAV